MNKTLQHLRLKTAEFLWQDYNFGDYQVDDADGWESLGDSMSRVIYIESDNPNEPTHRGRFHIDFEPGSTLIQSCSACMSNSGAPIGEMLTLHTLNALIRELPELAPANSLEWDESPEAHEEFDSAFALIGPVVRFVADTASTSNQSPSPSYAAFDVDPHFIGLILKSQAFCREANEHANEIHVSIPWAAVSWGSASEDAQEVDSGKFIDCKIAISKDCVKFSAEDTHTGSRIKTQDVQIDALIADYMAAKAEFNSEVILCKADGPGLANYEAEKAQSQDKQLRMALRG